MEENEEIKIHRLIALSNFLLGLRSVHSLDESLLCELTTTQKGITAEGDNLTLSWVIGFFPIVFGKHWTYNNQERIVLKGKLAMPTYQCIQEYFGINQEEYFHLFVAYFQNHKKFGGKNIPHNMVGTETISSNIRELVRIKIQKQNRMREDNIKHDYNATNSA